LSLLLGLFIEELRSQQLVDLWKLYEIAAESARSGSSPLLGKPLVLIDLEQQSAALRRFLSEMIAHSPFVFATSLLGDEEGTEFLVDLLGVSPETLCPDRGSETSLHRLRKNLFLAGESPSTRVDSSFQLFSAPGEGRECVEIARRVLSYAGRGTTFDRMAVFLRNPHLYQPQLQDAFSRAGIPCYLSRGTVRPDPAGRAMLVLLACAAEGLTASRFAEFLSLGQVPRSVSKKATDLPWVAPSGEDQMVFKTTGPDEVGSPLPAETDESPVIEGTLRTPIHWERLLVDAAVIGGRDRWRRRLKGLERELVMKQKSAEAEVEKASFRKQLAQLHNLKAFALPIIDTLANLPDAAKWGQWLQNLRELAVIALRKPESVLEVLAELQPMENVGPVDLGEVREVLSGRLNDLRQEPPKHRYGRVFVGTLEEAAGRAFEVVFLPGLAEGIFPRTVLEDPLLLDEARNNLGVSLVTRQKKAEKERLLLRRVAGAATDRLLASYPRMDVTQGRARVPSLYALELIKSAQGFLPDLGTLERRAAADADARLGWPAPADPDEAIDTAEYDLAILEPLLYSSGEAIVGRGRFLLEVNSFLARSMRARYKRWLRGWSDDDGIVAQNDSAVTSILDEHRLRRRSYSPTALQNYAACPYRFFLHGIQRLQPRETITMIEQMDPLIRGSLFHEVQFELFGRLDSDQSLSFGSRNLEKVLDRVDEILDRVAARYREELAPAIPRVWESEIEDLRVDLRCWIRDISRNEPDYKPLHWEFSFGIPVTEDRDRASREESVEILEGIKLRGSIDLVELKKSGESIRVIDHKTGKAPTPVPRFVGSGELLQPLLYGLAAEQLLATKVESAQLFYCTQRGGFRRFRFELSGDARSRIRQVMDTIDRALERGFLPAAPREGACDFCDYRVVCGPYEELRAARKPSKPMAELEAIRKIP
jgi:CRISPR/Cas system-associated exonuclease Cas4 (RecB family)